ncbi:PAS domain S-box protein [bacterium]|nr:PAS domain S-box protein [bacterium]
MQLGKRDKGGSENRPRMRLKVVSEPEEKPSGGTDSSHSIEVREALRQSNRFLHAVLDNMPGGVVVVDAESEEVLLANEIAQLTADRYGVSLVGHTLHNVPERITFLHYDRSPVRYDDMPIIRSLQRGEVCRGEEFLVQAGNGDKMWIMVQSAPIRDEDGVIIAAVMNFEDITAHKNVNERVYLQDRALTAAYNAIMITDADGVIQWVNEGLKAMTGYDERDVVGRHVAVFRSGEHSDEFYDEIWERIQHGEPWSGELLSRRKDGTIYPELQTVTPVRDRAGNIQHFIAIKQDISDRKKAEEDRKRFEAETFSNFHLTQLGLIASGIVHNLRNPASIIQSNADFSLDKLEELLSSGETDSRKLFDALEENAARLKKIQGAAERVAGIIDDIMIYHQQNVNEEKTLLDLNGVLEVDVGLLQSDMFIKHQIEVRRSFHTEPLLVRARAGTISQMFTNLVTNARDAMMDSERRVLSIRTGRSDGEAWLEVHDTGSGIPEGLLERLGTPFMTTKRDDERARKRGSGNGLGLYMIRRNLERLHGRMDVTSQPGNTRFRLYIPLVEDQDRGEQAYE